MDRTEILKIVERFVSAIKANYDCDQVFLFGSYANGTNHEDSDIDIAVIFPEFKSSITMQLELMRLRRKIDSRIEPHPFRAKDFKNTNPVANEILRHGQRIDIADAQTSYLKTKRKAGKEINL